MQNKPKKTKKAIKVHDLKPAKDAKGGWGGGHHNGGHINGGHINGGHI